MEEEEIENLTFQETMHGKDYGKQTTNTFMDRQCSQQDHAENRLINIIYGYVKIAGIIHNKVKNNISRNTS